MMNITKTTTLTFTALAMIAGAMVWAVEFSHKSSMLYPRGVYGSRC
ncbi:MAG: hypothetical protein LBG52_07290 [Candidatus Peribacteria bacterium]|nr:hypothetical protein [Candidatus Peribacteria bacterium]